MLKDEYDLNKAAELRHGRIPSPGKRIKQMEAEVNKAR